MISLYSEPEAREWPTGRSASISTSSEVHPLIRVSPLKSSPPSCSYSLYSEKERNDYLDRPKPIFPGVFPLVRAGPLTGGGLTNGTPVKKRRSSSSPEDSTREKVPHLDKPSTSTGLTGEEKKDVNLTAELFWLKTQLVEQWPIKWLWQVGTYTLYQN